MGSVEGPLAGVPVSGCGPGLGVPPGGGIWEGTRTRSACLQGTVVSWGAALRAAVPTQPAGSCPGFSCPGPCCFLSHGPPYSSDSKEFLKALQGKEHFIWRQKYSFGSCSCLSEVHFALLGISIFFLQSALELGFLPEGPDLKEWLPVNLCAPCPPK